MKFAILAISLTLSAVAFAGTLPGSERQKDIIFILNDDMGFNDPSFRGNNQILTPNLDALFYKGVTLNRYYTHPLCTPTRSAILTGFYAHSNGMHHEVTWTQQPWGLGLDQKLFPQYLKEVGYQTHIIGKWHLGHHQKQYFPTERGFDSWFGHLSPYVDYYTREFAVPPSNFPGNNYTRGYDFYSDTTIDRSDPGMYITDLLTNRAIKIIKETPKDQPYFLYFAQTAMHRANDNDPLPTKPEDLEFYSHIENPERRQYAAMLKSVDDNLGRLFETLRETDRLKDTIIVVTTDNGGPTSFRIVHPNTASNWPLKGVKGCAWEGSTRVDTVVYAPFLPEGELRNDYFHVADWTPTLAALSKSGVTFDRKLDGIDQSRMIAYGDGPKRHDIETIDPIYLTTSIIEDEYKLMNSSFRPLSGLIDNWLGSNDQADRESDTYISRVQNSKVAEVLQHYKGPLQAEEIVERRAARKVTCNDQEIVPCNILEGPCLFNIIKDPCERNNLANDPAYAEKLSYMKKKLDDIVASRVSAPRNLPGDFLSDPSLHGGVWTWWQEDTDTA